MPPKTTAPRMERLETGLGKSIDFTAPGDAFEGTFIGFFSHADRESGEVFDYIRFRDDEGRTRFTWTKAQLKIALESCDEGDKVRIEYLGEEDIDGGSKRVKNFDVFKIIG